MSKAVVYNKSKTYLLPLLSELIEFNDKFINNLENTYMYVDVDHYPDHLFVLHDYAFEDPEFIEYEKTLEDNELYVDSIDVGNQILFIFKFPEEYLHEYKCLEEGRYSAFGIDAKELILQFWHRAYGKTFSGANILLRIKHILFKDKKLKMQMEKKLEVSIDDSAELGDIVNKEQETFNLAVHLKNKE